MHRPQKLRARAAMMIGDALGHESVAKLDRMLPQRKHQISFRYISDEIVAWRIGGFTIPLSAKNEILLPLARLFRYDGVIFAKRLMIFFFDMCI